MHLRSPAQIALLNGFEHVPWQIPEQLAPASPVALAYIDQLTRGKSITSELGKAVKDAVARADGLGSSKRGAAAAVGALDMLAGQLEKDAAAGNGIAASRMRALASTLKGRAEKIR